MVADQRHPGPVKNLPGSEFLKVLDGQGRGNVVAQGDIHPGHDQFARFHVIFTAVRRENFLGYGLGFGHINAYDSLKAGKQYPVVICLIDNIWRSGPVRSPGCLHS